MYIKNKQMGDLDLDLDLDFVDTCITSCSLHGGCILGEDGPSSNNIFTNNNILAELICRFNLENGSSYTSSTPCRILWLTSHTCKIPWIENAIHSRYRGRIGIDNKRPLSCYANYTDNQIPVVHCTGFSAIRGKSFNSLVNWLDVGSSTRPARTMVIVDSADRMFHKNTHWMIKLQKRLPSLKIVLNTTKCFFNNLISNIGCLPFMSQPGLYGHNNHSFKEFSSFSSSHSQLSNKLTLSYLEAVGVYVQLPVNKNRTVIKSRRITLTRLQELQYNTSLTRNLSILSFKLEPLIDCIRNLEDGKTAFYVVLPNQDACTCVNSGKVWLLDRIQNVFLNEYEVSFVKQQFLCNEKIIGINTIMSQSPNQQRQRHFILLGVPSTSLQIYIASIDGNDGGVSSCTILYTNVPFETNTVDKRWYNEHEHRHEHHDNNNNDEIEDNYIFKRLAMEMEFRRLHSFMNHFKFSTHEITSFSSNIDEWKMEGFSTIHEILTNIQSMTDLTWRMAELSESMAQFESHMVRADINGAGACYAYAHKQMAAHRVLCLILSSKRGVSHWASSISITPFEAIEDTREKCVLRGGEDTSSVLGRLPEDILHTILAKSKIHHPNRLPFHEIHDISDILLDCTTMTELGIRISTTTAITFEEQNTIYECIALYRRSCPSLYRIFSIRSYILEPIYSILPSFQVYVNVKRETICDIIEVCVEFLVSYTLTEGSTFYQCKKTNCVYALELSRLGVRLMVPESIDPRITFSIQHWHTHAKNGYVNIKRTDGIRLWYKRIDYLKEYANSCKCLLEIDHCYYKSSSEGHTTIISDKEACVFGNVSKHSAL